MNDERYNGWRNRETAMVVLWFGDEIWDRHTAGETITAEIVEAIVTEYVEANTPKGSSFIADMMDMSKVDYEEIAEGYASDGDDDDDDDDDDV